MNRQISCSKLNVMDEKTAKIWEKTRQLIDEICAKGHQEVILIGDAVTKYSLFESVVQYVLSKNMELYYLAKNMVYKHFSIIVVNDEKVCFETNVERYVETNDNRMTNIERVNQYGLTRNINKETVIVL